MNSEELDRVLERGLAGEVAGPLFRARALEASRAALAGRRRRHVRWRVAALSAAAVLIAGVAFLGGRYSVLRWETGTPPGAPPAATPVARTDGTMAVPGEMVEWVNAARLFKQLGMEERVGRALDHAGRLMPVDVAGPGPVFAGGAGTCTGQEEHVEETYRPDWPGSLPQMSRIMAQSLGD